MIDVFKPLYAAAALLGEHVLELFHQLLIDASTTYSTLITACPKLHDELTTIDQLRIFSKHQVFTFVNNHTFKKSFAKCLSIGQSHTNLCRVSR